MAIESSGSEYVYISGDIGLWGCVLCWCWSLGVCVVLVLVSGVCVVLFCVVLVSGGWGSRVE